MTMMFPPPPPKDDDGSCLYIGSQDDLEPTERLPFIKTWIYVDSMPKSEGYDDRIHFEVSDDEEDPIRWKEDIDYRQQQVLKKWKITFQKFGDLVSDSENLMVFRNGERTLYFFYNSLYPTVHSTEMFRTVCENAKYLYMQRFTPGYKILTLPNLKTLLIGDDIYLLPRKDSKDVITFLYKNFVEDIKYVYVGRTIEKVDDLLYYRNLLDVHHHCLKAADTSADTSFDDDPMYYESYTLREWERSVV